MNPRLLLATMVRESRGARGRMAFFVACLAVGVAAVVGTGSLVHAVESAVSSNARKLLAADLALESRSPLPDAVTALLPSGDDDAAGRTTRVIELVTMAAAADGASSGRSRLVELRAIDGVYPYYGDLVLDPPGSLDTLLDDESAAVGPELLSALGLDVGDAITLGGARFRVATRVLEEPDRLEFSLAMGPRVLVTRGGLDRTSLLRFGSRVDYKTLVEVPGATLDELDALRDTLEAAVPTGERVRVRTWRDSQENVQRGVERVERYLGLAALLSLVMGGTGVAQIVRAWLAGRTQGVAVLRCLGFRPREILVLYLGHVALLASVGCLVGATLGALLPAIVAHFAGDLLPLDQLPLLDPAALLRGVALGLGIALLFALPPLSAIWRVSPARVLRAEAAPLPSNRIVSALSALLLVSGLFGAAYVQGRDVELAAGFTGGLLALALTLALASRAVMVLVGRLPRARLSPYLLHGMGALARPGAGTTGAIVALGLGVLVVMDMALVRDRLGDDLGGVVPADAPTAFLVDIQPDQWDGVHAILEQHGATRIDSVPVVMARLSAVKGRSVQELLEEAHEHGHGGRSEWRLTREQRLTWLDALPSDNTLVEGALWSDPEHAELSLEKGFADDLDVGVGDTLTFDVQGVPIELLVTSLRTVEWRSFGINFFLVVEPGVLEQAPHYRIAAVRLPSDERAATQDALVGACPNVAFLDIADILTRVMDLMERLAFGVRVLGTFTIVTGLLVLAGAIGSTTLRRAREAALLKTLGVTRAGVVALFASEYALQGAVAGAVGGAFAVALSSVFLEQVLELDAQIPWLALPAAVLFAALMATLCGVAASWRALSAPPIDTLRG